MRYEIRIGSPHPRPAFGFGASSTSRDAYQDLLRLYEGLLADDEINPAEVAYLKSWVERHPQRLEAWPFSDLVARLDAMLADGVVSPEECGELADILRSLIGRKAPQNDARLAGAGMPGPTRLIFDDPAPPIIFDGREFCVTGTFAFGQRKAVENAIHSRGGQTIKAPRRLTHYGLVGSFVSPGWANGNYGTKIERALSLKRNGAIMQIIEEEHWRLFLE